MHALGELGDVVRGRVEGEAYVAVGTSAFDAQRQSVPVDGERLDADRAVQAVGVDEPGEPFDGVGMAVREMRQQPCLGRGERIRLGGGELVEVHDHGAGRLPKHHTGGGEGEPLPSTANQPASHSRERIRLRTGTGATSANSSTADGSPRGAQIVAASRVLSSGTSTRTRPSSPTVCAPTSSSRVPSAVTEQDHAAASTERARSAAAGAAVQLWLSSPIPDLLR